MSAVEVRPYRRSNLDQLTQLVNTHVAAVIPGLGRRSTPYCPRWSGRRASSSKTPGVSERVTLVAEQAGRTAGARRFG
jgi:hypothetical protein